MKRKQLLTWLPVALAVFLLSSPVGADSSAEKTAIRGDLLIRPRSIEAEVRLGINIVRDIIESPHRNFAAEAASALWFLDEETIGMLEDGELKEEARRARGLIYTRLLMPDEAEDYPSPGDSTKTTSGFGWDIEMPYYIDLGWQFETPETVLLPYAGIGLIKSTFSSMVGAATGVKYFRRNLTIELAGVQGIVPDFSCFDYDLAETYGRLKGDISFRGHLLRLETAAGKRLYAKAADDTPATESLAFTAFGLTEKAGLELLVYNDGMNKVSGEVLFILKQVPERNHHSYALDLALPLTFDRLGFEYGFLPRFFHAGFLRDSAESSIAVGRRHFVYQNGVMLGEEAPSSPYYRFYETAAAVDGVIRFFLPLAAPADRLYLGLNGSAGIGFDTRTGETDLLWAGGFSAGFDLDDNIPFELRFGLDQEGSPFLFMTVVNRIYHPF